MINIIPLEQNFKSCGECTVCCEGYLHGEVNGHKFYDGQQCFYLKEKKCSIYYDRPVTPCRQFNCFWKITQDFTPEMRPDISKVLMVTRQHHGIDYLQVREVSKKIDSLMLSNIIQYAFLNNINLEYEVEGKYFYLGSKEFLEISNKGKQEKHEIFSNYTNI
jgi:hypothetical protein